MKFKVIKASELPERYKVKNGDVGTVVDIDELNEGYLLENKKWYMDGRWWFHKSWVSIVSETPNRDFLRDFCEMNNIKKTLVSKALGKSHNWLTQMVNDKRRDMTDETLQSILKQLHIDWTSKEFLNVRSEVPYRTKPCNYSRVQDKERLQRAFWSGEVTL